MVCNAQSKVDYKLHFRHSLYGFFTPAVGMIKFLNSVEHGAGFD